jgi:hypothetical protein
MKTGKCFVMITAVAALFMISAQAQAYSLSGCWITPGNSTAVGSLYSILNPVVAANFTLNNIEGSDPSYHYDTAKHAFAREYVLITGSNGTVAFSGGELGSAFGNRTVNLSYDGHGYNLESFDDRDITNVSSIRLVQAITSDGSKVGNTAYGYSPTLTVSGGGMTSATYTATQLASMGYTSGTNTTLINQLKTFGVDTTTLTGLNESMMFIFQATDTYASIVSLGELLYANNPNTPDLALFNSSSGYVRLSIPSDVLGASAGRSTKYVASITGLNPVPIPASLFLFAPAILSLIGLKRKRILN